MGADGALDMEATAKKIADGYTNLERRMGAGDAPPQSVDGYKLNLPDELAARVNADELAKAADFQEFRKSMHGLGLSQKQMDGVTATLLERGLKLREAMPVLDAAETTAKLRGMDGWKTDAEYQRSIGQAYSAGKHYFAGDFEGVLKDYGNDPRIITMLQRLGSEMGEDVQPSAEALGQIQANLDQLMTSPAYLNDRHPQHRAVFDQVSALTAKLSGTRGARENNSFTFKS